MDHHLLEGCAHQNALRDVSPQLELGLGIGLMLLALAASAPGALVLVLLAAVGLTVGAARIPFGLYLRVLAVPAGFVLISSALLVVLTQGGLTLASIDLGFVADHRDAGRPRPRPHPGAPDRRRAWPPSSSWP